MKVVEGFSIGSASVDREGLLWLCDVTEDFPQCCAVQVESYEERYGVASSVVSSRFHCFTGVVDVGESIFV